MTSQGTCRWMVPALIATSLLSPLGCRSTSSPGEAVPVPLEGRAEIRGTVPHESDGQPGRHETAKASAIKLAAAEEPQNEAANTSPERASSLGMSADELAANPLPPRDDQVLADSSLTPSTQVLDLSSVLFFADAQNPNIEVARERINESYARVDRAEVLWLPSLRAGLNYSHHEGRTQNAEGEIIEVNRSSLYGGLGAGAIGGGQPSVHGLAAQFHLSDAIFQPRIAEFEATSRRYAATAERNNIVRDAAIAYLELVRAEHGLAIAEEALANTRELAEVTAEFARTGQGSRSDQERMLAEVAVREYEVVRATEAVEVASARLAQLLHVDPSVRIRTAEPAITPLNLIADECTAAEYVALGLSRRPELAEQRNLVQEAIERMRREKYAPLVPSIMLGLSSGAMGGGLGSDIVNTSDRWDADAMAFWEIRNLGFGEHAVRRETTSVIRQRRMRQVALLDQVAREVTEAHAQVLRRKSRIDIARRGISAAAESFELNADRIRNIQGLPIEVLQAVQALATARRNYLDAVIDYNISQFELCRATGEFIGSVTTPLPTDVGTPPPPAPASADS